MTGAPVRDGTRSRPVPRRFGRSVIGRTNHPGAPLRESRRRDQAVADRAPTGFRQAPAGQVSPQTGMPARVTAPRCHGERRPKVPRARPIAHGPSPTFASRSRERSNRVPGCRAPRAESTVPTLRSISLATRRVRAAPSRNARPSRRVRRRCRRPLRPFVSLRADPSRLEARPIAVPPNVPCPGHRMARKALRVRALLRAQLRKLQTARSSY
jgi:hypothetical protein